MDIVLFIQFVHSPDIDKDQDHENVNRSLLGKPEAQFGTSYLHRVHTVNEENTETIRNQKPDGQKNNHRD